MQNSYDRTKETYAGFWVRLAAYVIDSVLVFLGLLIVRLLLSVMMSALQGTVLGGNILFHYTLKDILLYICQVLYFILCTYYTGTTLGKRAMNLRVVNADGSEKLSLPDVVYRETVGRFLCSMTAGIGYLIAGLDPEKRGIHDMLCDTRVVYAVKVKKIKTLPETYARGIVAETPQEEQEAYARGTTQQYSTIQADVVYEESTVMSREEPEQEMSAVISQADDVRNTEETREAPSVGTGTYHYVHPEEKE